MPYPTSTVIKPAISIGLCSLAAAKDELGLDPADTSQDGIIGRQIQQVSASINSYCGRVFVRQTYRDTFRDTCRTCGPLVTRQSPIALEAGEPVLVITELGSLLAVAEYEVHSETGSLYRLDLNGAATAWTADRVVVDYDAGFDAIPHDLQAACLQWLTARHSMRGRDPMLRSQTIPDVVAETYWVDPAAPAVPASVSELLRPYCMWPI